MNIRSNNADGVRELVRGRGRRLMDRAVELCDGDREAARAAVTEAVKAAVTHLRKYPDEVMGEDELSEMIHAGLMDAVAAQREEKAREALPACGWQLLRLRSEEGSMSVKAPRKKDATVYAFKFAFLSFIAMASLWMLAGILMSMGWMPYIDLGYERFNDSVFMLF